jgi:hypothetical protein
MGYSFLYTKKKISQGFLGLAYSKKRNNPDKNKNIFQLSSPTILAEAPKKICSLPGT